MSGLTITNYFSLFKIQFTYLAHEKLQFSFANKTFFIKRKRKRNKILYFKNKRIISWKEKIVEQ